MPVPPGPRTVTTNWCEPGCRLLTCHGELHGTAVARSREHEVLVIVPDVAHAKVAVDDGAGPTTRG